MESGDKKRIAVTAVVVAVVLLLVVWMISAGGSNTAGPSTGSGTAGSAETADPSTSSGTAATDSVTEPVEVTAGAERGATAVTFPEEAAKAETATNAATESTTVKKDLEGYILYQAKPAVLKSSYDRVAYDTEPELKTMFAYWSDANLAAVRDLVALPRYEAMSASLSGSKDFYYYGDRNAEGVPDGKGVAVYADNQYYYGDFKEGVREGKGEWLQRYPVYMKDVVIEHYYTGEWARNMPNGMGQDHYEYNENRMEEHPLYLLNAIGAFKDGYYDGEMYVMIENRDGSYTEWSGNCKEGVFDLTGEPDGNGLVPVMHAYEDPDHHIWIKPVRNKNFRVENLIVP